MLQYVAINFGTERFHMQTRSVLSIQGASTLASRDCLQRFSFKGRPFLEELADASGKHCQASVTMDTILRRIRTRNYDFSSV